MTLEPAPDKRELRRKLRDFLKSLPDGESAAVSLQAQALLRRQAVWKNARSILFYAPLAGEIDLSPLLREGLEEGKIIALPRFAPETGDYEARQIRGMETDCVRGKFGIWEPSARCPCFSLKQLDLALVPGIGFDMSGHRLGRGRGFYDRLLASFGGGKCGVAFDPQVLAGIPNEAHDVVMNFILTPTRWLKIPD
jgi:5-formyltetrahydrofolate cyclo-ligase